MSLLATGTLTKIYVRNSNDIMDRAGMKTWPKLFQNLRASCSTELAQEFPAHVAAAWIGHSVEIANKHYWQVTDDDFARAVGETKTAQNPAQ